MANDEKRHERAVIRPPDTAVRVSDDDPVEDDTCGESGGLVSAERH